MNYSSHYSEAIGNEMVLYWYNWSVIDIIIEKSNDNNKKTLLISIIFMLYYAVTFWQQ